MPGSISYREPSTFGGEAHRRPTGRDCRDCVRSVCRAPIRYRSEPAVGDTRPDDTERVGDAASAHRTRERTARKRRSGRRWPVNVGVMMCGRVLEQRGEPICRFVDYPGWGTGGNMPFGRCTAPARR
jgi:hypothetical protein